MHRFWTWGAAVAVAGVVFGAPFAALAQASPAKEGCAFDRAAMLALNQDAFDQNPARGWRSLAARKECRPAAADLIRDYRDAHPKGELRLLYWHEGQLRAEAGQSEGAIPLLLKAKDGDQVTHWSLYVDATVAFLRRDRAALDAARARLAALPDPPAFARDAAEVERQTGRRPVFPSNLDVVDGLARCFSKPYEEAYGCR